MIGLADAFKDPEAEARSPLFLPNMAERVFSEHGALVTALDMEHRSGQEDMALSVAQAYASDKALYIEAPTGVGKSMAYLVPGIIHAMTSGRQMLVSTHTKALQEQVRLKDLELCRRLFKNSVGMGQYGEFRAAVLMGKGNYLCGTRLKEAINAGHSLFPTVYDKELRRIEEWSKTTRTGLLQELSPPPMDEVWEHVNADSPACNNRNCTPDTCPYRRARQLMEKAQVLIVNHSLLFSLLGAGYHPQTDVPGILHASDFAVIDEAHTVPAVATEHFGARVSDYAIRRQLLRLHNPTTRKGILVRYAKSEGVKVVERALVVIKAFFEDIAERFLMESDIVRLPHPDWIEPAPQEVLAELVNILSSEAKRIGEGPGRDELQGASLLFSSYRGAILDCVTFEHKDHVYWTERAGRGRVIALRSAPLDVAPYLRERLFRRDTSIILTSATLGSGDNMEGFVTRTGGNGALLQSVDSPFDFRRSMRVFIAEDAPAPEAGKMDLAWMTDMVRHCAIAVKGGTLVLFTSYRDMREVAASVEDDFVNAGKTFLLQGRDGSPGSLRERFAKAGNAVLFGTDSFWTGVDVPGPALSQVIVTRLPFENPSHPVAEARAQWHASRGDIPFMCLTVPDAVVKLRQGIGRLIRSRQDKGTLTILDSRILTKQYGRFFLNVLPNRAYQRFNASNAKTRFKPLET
ncbi:MAG: ATP-dependent DNA helicase [Opitutales bacterium]|nr:ATP-dependent DNA helicase [Opitutales bacterium]